MSSQRRHLSAVWHLRATGGEASPLRRTSDRIEAMAIRLLVTLALVVALPAGGFMGARHYAASSRAAAGSHPVTATVLASDPSSPPVGNAIAALHKARVTVSWQPPDGATRTKVIQMSAPQPVGARLSVWMDAAGDLTNAPKTTGELVVGAGLVALLVALGAASVPLLALIMVCALLDHVRLRAWAREWARVEPIWSRQAR